MLPPTRHLPVSQGLDSFITACQMVPLSIGLSRILLKKLFAASGFLLSSKYILQPVGIFASVADRCLFASRYFTSLCLKSASSSDRGAMRHSQVDVFLLAAFLETAALERAEIHVSCSRMKGELHTLQLQNAPQSLRQPDDVRSPSSMRQKAGRCGRTAQWPTSRAVTTRI